MSTWKGTLSFEDLGAGVWVLQTDEGKHQLSGAIPEHLDGKRVVVEGRAESVLGFGMTTGGRGIKVSSVREA